MLHSSRYGRPTIVVTESGCDVPNESQLDAATAVHDSFRVEYYRGYLAAAMQAKNIDGVRFEVRWRFLMEVSENVTGNSSHQRICAMHDIPVHLSCSMPWRVHLESLLPWRLLC